MRNQTIEQQKQLHTWAELAEHRRRKKQIGDWGLGADQKPSEELIAWTIAVIVTLLVPLVFMAFDHFRIGGCS